MTTRMAALTCILSAGSLTAQTTVVMRSNPLPSPQNIAALEAHVLQNPDDLNAQQELLQFYAVPAGRLDPARQSVRLQHILYLVQHHPEAAVSASRAAYIYRANGSPYADAADHETVRLAWLDAVEAHRTETAVTLNAVRFLEMEDSQDAEQVLRHAVEDAPENRELAANLGFVYAIEILKSRAAKAEADLRQSTNAIVLAAAGTAIPNLSKGYDSINGTMIDFANGLAARARELAPADADIQGPMPFIKYFVAAEEGLRAALFPAAQQAPATPTRIRVGENVQSANLIRRIEPQYPEEARQAGITGDVRLTVIINKDGTIQNVQLISGHPLLVDAAIRAVQSWQYKPTMLNGAPIEVVTSVTVSFPPATSNN